MRNSGNVPDPVGVIASATGDSEKAGHPYVQTPSLFVILPPEILALTVSYLPILNILVPHTGHTP
jgi:hypothetical protein